MNVWAHASKESCAGITKAKLDSLEPDEGEKRRERVCVYVCVCRRKRERECVGRFR